MRACSGFPGAYAEHTGAKQKTAPKGGLPYSDSVTTAWAYLFTGSSSDGVSHKPHMVELLGNYSKHGNRGKSTISLIEEATRCAATAETPCRNRNTPEERVKVLSALEVAKLIGAYQADESTYALARRFSIHRTTVSAHLHRAGVEPRVRGHSKTADNPT